jgi:HEAT repeat protein
MKWMLVLPAVLLFTLPAAARAPDDDPVIQTKKLSEWLEILRSDADPRRRLAAVIVADFAGVKRSRKVVPALVAAVRDDADEQVRERAAALLGQIADKLLNAPDKPDDFRFDAMRDALATALRGDKSARVRKAAATALGRMKKQASGAVGALAIGLKDASPETRAAAADVLRRLGPDAREALPEIQQVLQDKAADRATRVQCALAVGRIGAPDALPALPALKEVVTDAKAPFEVRKATAEALGQLGRDAAPAASALGQALTAAGTDYRLRREAAAALDAIGPDGRDALPDLIKALKDEDKYVRCHSLRAIGRYGKELGPETKTAVTALLRCLDDSVLDVRVAAIETFGALGAEGLGTDLKAVTERLTDATRDSQKVVSEAAASSLKKIQGMP